MAQTDLIVMLSQTQQMNALSGKDEIVMETIDLLRVALGIAVASIVPNAQPRPKQQLESQREVAGPQLSLVERYSRPYTGPDRRVVSEDTVYDEVSTPKASFGEIVPLSFSKPTRPSAVQDYEDHRLPIAV